MAAEFTEISAFRSHIPGQFPEVIAVITNPVFRKQAISAHWSFLTDMVNRRFDAANLRYRGDDPKQSLGLTEAEMDGLLSTRLGWSSAIGVREETGAILDLVSRAIHASKPPVDLFYYQRYKDRARELCAEKVTESL